ncbi:MAG: hydrogenase subunit MbhD domain-containing protein [Prochlorothrix sp.]
MNFLNSEQPYIFAIVALLPLTALMTVSQVNPYHALVIRGMLGAVAALVYALFGAADVALTEALVGTMLSITLYAVAVRSSLTLRLGIPALYLEQPLHPPTSLSLSLDQLLSRLATTPNPPASLQGTSIPLPTPAAPVPKSHPLEPLLSPLQVALAPAHLRIEWVPYADRSALETALSSKEIHGITWILSPEPDPSSDLASSLSQPKYHLELRIPRIYRLLSELPPDLVTVTLADLTDLDALASSNPTSPPPTDSSTPQPQP